MVVGPIQRRRCTGQTRQIWLLCALCCVCFRFQVRCSFIFVPVPERFSNSRRRRDSVNNKVKSSSSSKNNINNNKHNNSNKHAADLRTQRTNKKTRKIDSSPLLCSPLLSTTHPVRRPPGPQLLPRCCWHPQVHATPPSLPRKSPRCWPSAEAGWPPVATLCTGATGSGGWTPSCALLL